MRHFPYAFAALALAGCNQAAPGKPTTTPSAPATVAITNATVEPVPSGVPVSPSAAAQSDCGAGKAAKFLGKAATPQVRAEVARTVGHLRIRWIGPDDVVTMDYSEGRLNAELDDGGKIKGFRCG